MQLNHDRLSKQPCTLRRRWGPMLGRLTKSTHFDWEELESLCFVFHKLTRGSKGNEECWVTEPRLWGTVPNSNYMSGLSPHSPPSSLHVQM